MPIINVTVPVAVAAEQAWELVCDVESYPDYMESVRSAQILKHESSKERSTAWSVLLKGAVLNWVEREVMDPASNVLSFEQTSGDLERLNGSWTVAPDESGGCEVTLHTDFEIGIPLLANMLNPIAAAAFEDNARKMLAALERRVMSPRV